MKLNLGGIGTERGWTTVNFHSVADIKHDLNKFPYPFKDNSAEVIKMIHTLEHLDDPKRVMTEVYRILRNRGRVIIEVPHWKKDMFTNPEHKHYFRVDWFQSLRPTSAKYRNMENQCPFNFFMLDYDWIKGKHARWRKYSLRVIMEARK